MATTTNYGWTTPDDTALVKDGAAAIRTLGSSVDTTTKNLNPSTTLGDVEYRSSTSNVNSRLAIGTSGQALTVVAGVPSWAASSTSVLTTTGDTLYASAANTLARLGIGSAGQVLTVAAGLPSWATPASGVTFSGCKLYKSVGQTISNATSTVLTWDSETFDVDAYHSNVTNNSRITIPSGKTGYFLITVNVRWDINSAGARQVFIQDNAGTQYGAVLQPGIADEYTAQSFTTIIYATATSYFEVGVYQSRGGNLALRGGNILESSFGISYLGA
jgi:hypothetical protein